MWKSGWALHLQRDRETRLEGVGMGEPESDRDASVGR